MIVPAGNGLSVHSPMAAAYPQTAPVQAEGQRKEIDRNFDQVVISASESADKTSMMNIKSKVYNGMRTAVTTGKIAEIRAQIETGEYRIDSSEIARRMLLTGEA